MTKKDIQENGVIAGPQADGIYIGRTVNKDGETVPAKIYVSDRIRASYVHNGVEVNVTDFEYLENSPDFFWDKFEGEIPENAVKVSQFPVGRSMFKGHYVAGRVDLEAKSFIGGVKSEVFNSKSFDVLCLPYDVTGWCYAI